MFFFSKVFSFLIQIFSVPYFRSNTPITSAQCSRNFKTNTSIYENWSKLLNSENSHSFLLVFFCTVKRARSSYQKGLLLWSLHINKDKTRNVITDSVLSWSEFKEQQQVCFLHYLGKQKKHSVRFFLQYFIFIFTTHSTSFMATMCQYAPRINMNFVYVCHDFYLGTFLEHFYKLYRTLFIFVTWTVY